MTKVLGGNFIYSFWIVIQFTNITHKLSYVATWVFDVLAPFNSLLLRFYFSWIKAFIENKLKHPSLNTSQKLKECLGIDIENQTKFYQLIARNIVLSFLQASAQEYLPSTTSYMKLTLYSNQIIRTSWCTVKIFR